MMKIIKIIMCIFGLSILSCKIASPTVDLPVFYRTPFFQGEGRHKVKDWATKIIARYNQGQTWDSYDSQSKKQSLLSGVGPLDIARLGLGTNITQATQPKTFTYWGTGNNTENPLFNTVQLPTGNNGQVNLIGKFETQELGLELTQSLKYGFFGQIYAPIRSVKINNISYHNNGLDTVNNINIANFFQNTFDTILEEHDIAPLTTPFNKSGIADATVALGWNGYSKIGSEWIMNLAGSMQAGVLVPVAGSLDKKYVAAIPLGYNNNFGTFVRASGEIGVFDWIAVGAYGNAIMFFDQKLTLQMRTNEAQSGWLRLGTGFAKLSSGTLWDCGSYVRVGALIPGLSIFGGYSFTRQEVTTVTGIDPSFSVMLATVDPNNINNGIILKQSFEHGDVEKVVNNDPRFHAWEKHSLHVGATLEIDSKKAIFSPRLQIEYAYPFDGVLGFKTSMLGGTIGLQFSLGF